MANSPTPSWAVPAKAAPAPAVTPAAPAPSAGTPSWAVPQKSAAAPAPEPQKAPVQSGSGGIVSDIVSGVKSAASGVVSGIEGLFGKKPTAPAPAAPTPSWAVPQKSQSAQNAPVSKTTKTAEPMPAYAVPKAKATKSPLGDLFKPAAATTPSAAYADSSTSTTAGSTEAVEGKSESKNISDEQTAALASAAQSFPRTGAELGESIAQAGVNLYGGTTGSPIDSVVKKLNLPGRAAAAAAAKKDTGTIQTENPADPKTYSAMSAFMGTEPIQGMSSQVAALEQTIKNSPFAQKNGLAAHALPLAFSSVLAGETLNFAPFPGGEGGVVDALAKAATEDEAAQILRKTGMSENLVGDFASKFAAMTDKKEISDALTVAGALHGSTHPEAKQGMQDLKAAATPKSADALRQKQEELKVRIAIAQDSIDSNGTSQLMKYYGGKDPEDYSLSQIAESGARSGGKASSLDDMITELGYEDLDAADAGVKSYAKQRDELAAMKAELKETNASIKDIPVESPNGIPGELSHLENQAKDTSYDTFKRRLAGNLGSVDRNEKLDDDTANAIFSRLQATAQRGQFDNEKELFRDQGGRNPTRLKGDNTVVVHRASPSNTLRPGDFVGTDKHEAGFYTNKYNKIHSHQVKNSDLVSVEGSMGGGQELIYLPAGTKPTIPQEYFKNARDFWEKANGISPTKSVEQIARENLMAKLAKNQAANPDLHQPPQLPESYVSDAHQAYGLHQVEQGEIKSGPFKGWEQRTADLYQYGFANKRKPDTVQIAGAMARKKFESLAAEGTDGILKFEGFERAPDGMIVQSQSGPVRDGLYGEMQKDNDAMFAEERAAGVQVHGKPVPYRKNYLRVYIKSPEGDIYDGDGNIVASSGRKVGKTPAFSLPRQFDTNAEALQAGYQLAFDNAADIMAARKMESQKAIGDATLFMQGAREGLVIPTPALSRDKAIASGFKMYDPERFPQYSVRYQDRFSGAYKEYVGPYYGPAKFVDKVNAFLYNPSQGTVFQRGLQKVANVVGTTKNIALSIGIPNFSKIAEPIVGKTIASHIPDIGSGFSLHFWNLLPRATLAEHSPGAYFAYAMFPSGAEKYVQNNLDKALALAEQGLTLSAEEQETHVFDYKDLSTIAGAGRQINAASKWIHGVFGEGLFGKVMPAMKLRGAITRTERYVARGIPRQDAMRMATDEENVIWGGTNLAALGRDKDWQNFLRSVLIAPDYAETNIKMGYRATKGISTKFFDPKFSAYRNFAATFMGAYTIANMLQYESSGSFMVQNDPQHIFSIKWGKDSAGRTRYINPFGTGVDAFRIPAMLATALAENKYKEALSIITNRLSIPADSAMQILDNNDWAGNPLVGADNYGNPIPQKQEAANLFNATFGNLLPGFSGTILNGLTGKTSPEQALEQSIALPVGYVNEKPNQTTVKALEADAKAGIQNGDYTLFNELVKSGAISSRSRATFLRDALTGTTTAKQQRTSAKDKARIAKEEQNLEDEGFTKNSS